VSQASRYPVCDCGTCDWSSKSGRHPHNKFQQRQPVCTHPVNRSRRENQSAKNFSKSGTPPAEPRGPLRQYVHLQTENSIVRVLRGGSESLRDRGRWDTHTFRAGRLHREHNHLWVVPQCRENDIYTRNHQDIPIFFIEQLCHSQSNKRWNYGVHVTHSPTDGVLHHLACFPNIAAVLHSKQHHKLRQLLCKRTLTRPTHGCA
jgi:hypothetical protein